jgi:hypothetical protein
MKRRGQALGLCFWNSPEPVGPGGRQYVGGDAVLSNGH